MLLIIHLHQVLYDNSVTDYLGLLLWESWLDQEVGVVHLQAENFTICTEKNNLEDGVRVNWAALVGHADNFDHVSNKSHLVASFKVAHTLLKIKWAMSIVTQIALVQQRLTLAESIECFKSTHKLLWRHKAVDQRLAMGHHVRDSLAQSRGLGDGLLFHSLLNILKNALSVLKLKQDCLRLGLNAEVFSEKALWLDVVETVAMPFLERLVHCWVSHHERDDIRRLKLA